MLFVVFVTIDISMIILNQKKINIFIYGIVFFVASLLAECANNDTIYHTFFSKPKFVKNQITFDCNFGLSIFNNQQNSYKISNANNIDIKYAFSRIYPKINSSNQYYASEFIGLENISSDLKLPSSKSIGIPIDLWRFSIGYRNGNIVQFGIFKSILYHSGSLNWNKADFPNYQITELKTLKDIDKKFSYGTGFDFGISTKIIDPLFLNIQYNNSLLFTEFNFFQYLGAATIELALQRTIDYLDFEFASADPTLFPIISWLAKGTLSLLLYSARESESFFPLGGKSPITQNSFKIGVSFILKSTSKEKN